MAMFSQPREIEEQFREASGESFSDVVDSIKENICKKGVYAPYIEFTVLGTLYGDFTFTTEDHNKCMITAFENVKNGSGQANTFSLTISFSPSNNSLFYDSSTTGVDYSNINLIDELLVLGAGTIRKCLIRYGYGYPKLMLSPLYEGVILDYTTEISNGVLTYTITGYSGIAGTNKDTRITVEETTTTDDEGNVQPIMKKPTTIVQETFDKHLKDSGYVLEFAENTKDTDTEIQIPAAQDVTPIQYIKTVLDSATYSEDTEETPAEEKSLYCMIISDKSDDKKITITRYDPVAVQENIDENSLIRFSWMGPTNKDSGYDYSSNAMVIDFKADYKGSVAMAFDYSKYNDVVKKYGIDSKGETKGAASTSTPTTGSNTENDNAVTLNLWASRMQYCYTASLVTLGIPYEMKILDNIYVAPMICGQEHHTGGVYKITKITDVIDGSGFTTSFELARNQASPIQNQYKKAKEAYQKTWGDSEDSPKWGSVNSPGDISAWKSDVQELELLRALGGEDETEEGKDVD